METRALIRVFCMIGMVWAGIAPLSAKENAEEAAAQTTQAALAQYRQAVEDTCVKNSKPTDKKLRDLLLTSLKANFKKELGSATVQKQTIARHFESFMENIAAAKTGFKFKDGDTYRDQFFSEAAHVFVREVKEATDLDAERTPNGWFETFSGMLVQARDKLAFRPGIGGRVASVISPAFMEVYKASKMNLASDPGADFKVQMALVKKQFPASSDELKERNGAFAKLLEAHVNSMLKERNK